MKLAGGAKEPEPPADPLRFEEAVSSFRRRVPMSDEAFRAMKEASHARAFIVAGVAKADLVDEVWRALDKAVADGMTFADFKKSVGDKIEAEWGRKNPARLETIFRTNLQRSYGAGTVEMLRRGPVMKRRPYWKFSSVLDSRTTAVCKACNGTVLPATHPFWMSHQPPLHFNCRSRLIALTEAQARAAGVSDIPLGAPPEEGFGNVEEAAWRPDLSKYPAQLAHAIQEKLSAPRKPVSAVSGEVLPPGAPPLVEPVVVGPASSTPPPWRVQARAERAGVISEVARKFSPAERKLAGLLAFQGNEVEAIAERPQEGRSADALVNGAKVEFKRLEKADPGLIYRRVNDALRRGGQASSIILDVRKVDISREQAVEQLQRLAGRKHPALDFVRIIGKDFDVTMRMR